MVREEITDSWNEKPESRSIIAVYTNIGRGHPNYLDSVLRYLRTHHPDVYNRIRVTSVYEQSGGLSLMGWKMVRAVYRYGSRGGIVSALYSTWRTNKAAFDRNSLFVRLLQRDLLAHLGGYAGICLVAHPLLATILKDQHRVFSLHGEIAAPVESAVQGVEKMYVPLPLTRERMITLGVAADSLITTGLVLEPELCSGLDDVVRRRIQRLASSEPLTVGFFISGAYPRRHIELIFRGVESCYRVGMKVRLFWGCDEGKVRHLQTRLLKFADQVFVDDGTSHIMTDAQIAIITAKTREAETVRSMDYLADLDVFCAAPHERVNWAVGAGLPMIMITPTIGTFAPESRAIVLKTSSGIELSAAVEFSELGKRLIQMRLTGLLREMIEAGCQITSIHGAEVIAEDLVSCTRQE